MSKRGPPLKHGFFGHPIYQCWNSMMQRCYNEKQGKFKDYGARGILVCDDWHDVAKFIDWATDNGWAKGLQIDREDNHKGYFPENCHFVPPRRNSNNRRSNLIVSIEELSMTFADAHQRYGLVKYETARKRFQNYGWSLMDALQKPPDPRGYHSR